MRYSCGPAYWVEAHCILGAKINSATKPTSPGGIPDYEPFPFRQRKKRRKVGPFSKRLSFAMLDLRTQEGREARDISDGIAADLGGKLNVTGLLRTPRSADGAPRLLPP